MFILDWLHHFFNPHCEICRDVYESGKMCQNCEYLKLQLEKEQQLNRELIEKLTKPEERIEYKPQEPQVPLKSRFTPWHVKRQMLEAEDRVAAQKLKEVQEKMRPSVEQVATVVAPPDDPDVIALERELQIVEQERENASGKR